MKANISFSEAEFEKIMQIAQLAKRLFPAIRMHPPKPGNDGKFHMHLTSQGS